MHTDSSASRTARVSRSACEYATTEVTAQLAQGAHHARRGDLASVGDKDA